MNFIKNVFKNLLAFCVSMSVGLLIGEFVVRVFFPQVTSPVQFFYDAKLGGMIPVPNQKGFKNHPNVYHYDYQNNEVGMRDTRQLLDYQAIPFKILSIGDSFTYGWGVNDEESFCKILEKNIHQDSVAVLNAGASGAGTDYALKFFRVRGKDFLPKVVIYYYYENDQFDNQDNRYFTVKNDSIITNNSNEFASINAIQKNKLANSLIYNWFSAHSHLFGMIRTQVGVFWNNKIKKENEAKVIAENRKQATNQPVETQPEKVIEAKKTYQSPYYLTYKYIKALSDEVKSSGAKFYIFHIPSHHSIGDYQKFKRMDQNDSLSIFCLKNQINYHSFTQTLFKNKDPLKSYYFPVDFHWNKAGHQVAGEYVYEVLKKDKIVK